MLDLSNRFAELRGPRGTVWEMSIDRPAEFDSDGILKKLGEAFVVVDLVDSSGKRYRVSGLRRHVQIEVG